MPSEDFRKSRREYMRKYRANNPQYTEINRRQTRERARLAAQKQKPKPKVIPRPRRRTHIPKDVPTLDRNVKQMARVWDDIIKKQNRQPKRSIRPNIPPLKRSVKQIVHQIEKGGKKYEPKPPKQLPGRSKVKQLQEQLLKEVNKPFKSKKPTDIPKLKESVKDTVRKLEESFAASQEIEIKQTASAFRNCIRNYTVSIVHKKI